MAKKIITALEQAVLKSISSVNNSVPQNIVSKGLVVRSKDLFGTNVTLTRSGKIQTTKVRKTIAFA